MFFQNTIIKKYLAMLNDEQVKVAWEQCNQWADQEYYDAIAESGGRPIF